MLKPVGDLQQQERKQKPHSLTHKIHIIMVEDIMI
jgi:hypothetical protein